MFTREYLKKRSFLAELSAKAFDIPRPLAAYAIFLFFILYIDI